jgi:polyisoprenoid-binding protein YceI
MMQRILPVLLVPAAVAVWGTSLRAQMRPVPIDSGHSYGSLWVGAATETSPPVNVAVTQAAGNATFDTKNPKASALQVTLVPGGTGDDLLTPGGTLREGEIARLMRYTVMSFQSTGVELRNDGRLAFSGRLTVKHVTREQIMAAWNSATPSPSYTDPKTESATRPVTFVLSTPRAELLAESLKKSAPFVATAAINAGDFPELSAAILDAYWPVVAQDEQCEFPVDSAGRRDYSGTVCTGRTISTTNAPRSAPSLGRDYSGPPKVEAAANGPVTILLYLKLAAAPGPKREPPSN